MGLAVFPSYHPLHAAATTITTPPPPHGGVEVRSPQLVSGTLGEILHPASATCASFHSAAPVSSVELRSGRSPVLAGVLDSGAELTNTRLVPDIQTSLWLSRPAPAATQ